MIIRRKKFRCTKCLLAKPASEFHRKSAKRGGAPQSECAECSKHRVREFYRQTREQRLEYERVRNQDPERRRKQTRYARERRQRDPLKYKARTAVGNALRDGRLVRKPCEVCGALKVQAHHEDYNRPLDVRWFCKAHHDDEHGTSVK